MAEASARARLRRKPSRGAYDGAAIDAVLDAGLVAHVGFAVDGQPFVIPTLYARVGETVYLHGSSASRMLRELSQGVPACLTVTLVDGLVLARSAFHHSMNYRSAVVFGTATAIADPDEKAVAVEAFMDRLTPGRWGDVRPPTARELKATAVLSLGIEEASVKVRSGPPGDDADDVELDVWAGVVPLQLAALAPEPDPHCRPDLPLPSYVSDWVRARSAG